MDFPPVAPEDLRPIFSLAKTALDVIKRLRDEYFNDEGDENGDRKDCIKAAILTLTQETQAEKSKHLEKFVENTLLNPECDLEPSSIFSFLEDIKQMTWRQICFIEGFTRKSYRQIEIIGMETSGVNGNVRFCEIERLVNLRYLGKGRDGFYFDGGSLTTEEIDIKGMGLDLSARMDLKSIPLDEIAKAFGTGRIKAIL